MQEYVPLRELINLTGKNAIVTGGAMGIGLAISRRLAEAGANVLLADVNAGEVRKASAELNSIGYDTKFTECDVAEEKDVNDYRRLDFASFLA